MKNIALIVSILATGLAINLTGCSSSEDTELTEQEANQVYSSTTAALVGVDSAAQAASVSGNQVTATANCAGGGSASVTGTFDGREAFNLDVDFQGCSESNITVDGTLQYAAAITDNGAAITMTGSLTYSGQIEATCTIDVTTVVNATTGVSIEGQVCGQDITVEGIGR